MKLRRNPIFWILETILGSGRNRFLILFWTFVVLATKRTVSARMSKEVKASTADRKFFHVAIVVVFVVGVVVDKDFLFFASTVVFALMVSSV
jgi:hypothetical protein